MGIKATRSNSVIAISHDFNRTGIKPIYFIDHCTTHEDLRWLCINGSEKDVCKRIYQLFKIGSLAERAILKCALEVYSMFAPSVVPENILGIAGVAVHYKEGDEEFLARRENQGAVPAAMNLFDGRHKTSSVDYLLNAADSVVSGYAMEHPGQVVMTRRGGLWTEYSHPDEGKTYLTRGVLV
jgi:hypothetical protein